MNWKRNRWAAAYTLMLALPLAANVTAAAAQMEKRQWAIYDARAFEAAKPTVGERAPDLQLRDLDGKPASLADYRGENLVVIKAGYT